jgi:hypothetical protein
MTVGIFVERVQGGGDVLLRLASAARRICTCLSSPAAPLRQRRGSSALVGIVQIERPCPNPASRAIVLRTRRVGKPPLSMKSFRAASSSRTRLSGLRRPVRSLSMTKICPESQPRSA